MGRRYAKAAMFIVLLALAGIGSERANPAGVATKVPTATPALRRLWQKKLPNAVSDQVDGMLVRGGVLFAYSSELGSVSVIDLASRRVLWTRQGQVHSEPDVLDDGDILLKHEDSIERVNRRTGKQRWRHVFDGGFSDDGYVAIAGNLACLVYHSRPKGNAPWFHDGLSARQVIDLRTGRPLAPQPVYPANPLNDVSSLPGSAPRFLYQAPDLWSLDVAGENPATVATYSLGCFDAVSGKRIWRTQLTSNLSHPSLQEADVWYPLGFFVVSSYPGGMETREFHWLDLSTGRALEKAVPPDQYFSATPIVSELSMPKGDRAKATLANVLLMSTSNSTFALMKPGSLSKPLWSTRLSVYLSEKAREGHTYWNVADTDWPFALLQATTELTEGLSTLVLIDVESKIVYPVSSARTWIAACLDRRGNMVVTVEGGKLSGYRLPRQAEKHH